jgi:hypothetical protein
MLAKGIFLALLGVMIANVSAMDAGLTTDKPAKQPRRVPL